MFQQYFSAIQHFALLVIGLFFVFSGGIKLRSPRDFSFKIAAYLSSFARDIHTVFLRLITYSFIIAVVVCAVEIVLGIMLVCSFRTIWVLWSLVALMIFFTFLAGYTISQKSIDSCGCLSESIPLTPVQSFIKNIILLLLLIWLICTYQTMV